MKKGLLSFLLLLLFTTNAFAITDTTGPWGINVNPGAFTSFSSAKSSPVTLNKTMVLTGLLNVNTLTVSNRDLDIKRGGGFTIAAGKILTIPIPHAGRYQIFYGSGTVNFETAGEIYPEWWGNNATPGITDFTAAMDKALLSIDNTGGTIDLDGYSYFIPNGINYIKTSSDSSHTWTIKGKGAKQSIIKTHNAPVSMDLGGRNRVNLEDFGIIDDGTTPAVGIARYREQSQGDDGGGGNHSYRNIYMEGAWSKAAIYSIASEVNNHYDLKIYQNGNGAGYYTASTNLLGATLAGTLRSGYTSNTVNNFYGGAIISASPTSSGGAVYVGSSADQLNFNGTYLVGWNQAGGGYDVKFGNTTSDQFLGIYTFINCRFEGQTDAITATAANLEGLTITGSTFGQNPGQDIKFTNTPSSYGLNKAYITNNYHFDKGMTLPVISNSHIKAVGDSTYHSTIVAVNNGNVSNSWLEGQIALTGSTYVYGSVIIDNRPYDGIYKVHYGPNSTTSPGNPQGSAIVNKPFGSAPVSPENGQIISVGVSQWEPTQTATLLDYPAFFNGSAWVPMVAIPATPGSATASGTKGTVAFDDSYEYICTKSGTAGTLSGVTGSISSGSTSLTVNTTTGLSVGSYLTIAGVAGTKSIISISGSTVTIDKASDATVAAAAVSYAVPAWKRIPLTW